MKIIPRDTYLDKMIRVINTPDIKVITGVRRAGKSKLLELFKNYKVNEYKQIHILSTLKRLIEEEKLAYNISTHGKSTTIDDINDRAYKVEKFLAFNKKLEVINSALKQKLINIRSNKKDLR